MGFFWDIKGGLERNLGPEPLASYWLNGLGGFFGLQPSARIWLVWLGEFSGPHDHRRVIGPWCPGVVFGPQALSRRSP